MSKNANQAFDSASTPSPAINVGFSSIADRHGESSSMAESRSSGKRSSKERDEHVVSSREQQQQHGQHDGVDSGGSVGRKNRKSGGFLLDSMFANGSPRGPSDRKVGKRKAQDGQLHVDKIRHTPNRISADSSLRGSPLSKEVQMDGAIDDHERAPSSRFSSMDATQLVQMALNLSESRKRQTSNTLQVPSPVAKRVTSGPMSNFGTVRARSSVQRVSSQPSDDVSQGTFGSDRIDNDDMAPVEPGIAAVTSAQDNIFYTFSPATLSRAEKARKYFELASEYRRLLHSLAPLKTTQMTNAPLSNGTTTNSPRVYNPIQSLRNRRIRIREKRPFPAPPDTWQDPEAVRTWVDDVEAVKRDGQYETDDSNEDEVPRYPGDDDTVIVDGSKNASRHRRTDTVGSVITRPENSWTIEPTELLADAYWTEKKDNKWYIENRYGNTVLPPRLRTSTEAPRISVEMHRDSIEEAPQVAMGDDHADLGRQSRRRRLMLPLAGSERRKHKRMASRTSSVSSASSDDERKLMPSRSHENIGPLERHMQDLIAKEERGELSSPEMTSPDRWDSNNLPYTTSRRSVDKERSSGTHRDSLGKVNGRISLEVPKEAPRRSRSTDGRLNSVDQNVSSTEEELGSEPASPVVSRNIPYMGMDLSTPTRSRRSFDEQKANRLKLPSFRSNSKDRHKIARTDFADTTGSALSPILSAGLTRFSSNESRPRTSNEETRTSMDFRRHGTNESVSSLKRLDTASTTATSGTMSSIREGGSAVGRLLKGGRDRIGGLVFSRNRDRLDTPSDLSDMDEEIRANGGLKRRPTDSPRGYESSDVSPRASFDRERAAEKKPKYHLSNLPSFQSSARDKRLQLDSPDSATGDPLKTAKRSERFDRLAPPKINLPNGGSSQAELVTGAGVTFGGTARKSYGDLDRSVTFGEAPRPTLMRMGLPVPGLTQAKRHWSIYDLAKPEQADHVAKKDIARVRALLLASGIKAREIQRRENTPRDATSTLTKAAETVGEAAPTVATKEESLVAARLLSDHLSSSLSGFESSISQFQSTTAGTLASQLDELRHRAIEHLTNLVHDTSDEADAFNVELTTRQPRDVKQVDDAIDLVLRHRRRQFMLLKRAGFKLLEWLVLSIMWWIWFLVVIFNTFRKIVMAIFRFFRWLSVL